MKKILVLLFLVSVVPVFKTMATVRVTVSSGNWDNPSVWGGTVPLANDDVIISSGHIITINVSPANIFNVTVNGTLQFDATGAGRAWTVAGSFFINPSGSFVCASPGSATTHTFNYNGTNLSNVGTLNMLNGSNKCNVVIGGSVTQTIGGSSTSTFNKLIINNTGGLITITSGTGVFTIAESNPTKLMGNIVTNDSLVIQRGLLVACGANTATLTHTVASLKMGSSTSKITSAVNIFTQLVTITINTCMAVNDATNSNVTVNVTGSFTSPNMTQANAAITLSLIGPNCQGGANNSTTMNIGGVTNIPDLFSLDGNAKGFGGIEPKRPDLVFNGDVTMEYNKSHTIDIPFTSDDFVIKTFFYGRVDSIGIRPRIILNGGTVSTPNNWNVKFEVFNSPVQTSVVFGNTTQAQISESAADWVINGNWKVPAGFAITVHADDTLNLNGSVRTASTGVIAGSDTKESTSAGPVVNGPLLLMGNNATIYAENPNGLGDGTLDDTLLNVAIMNKTSDLNWNLTSISSNGTVDYAGNTQTITDRSYNNLTLSGGAFTKTLSGNTTVNGVLTIGTSVTLADGGFNIFAKSSVVNNGTHSGSGKIILNGSSNQSLSGSGNEWGNFQLNNSGGATCSNNVASSGTVDLTSGVLTTSASAKLSLGSTASYTGGNASSYVNGPMSKTTTSNVEFIFPLGKGGTFRQLSVKPSTTATTVFTAEYFNSAFSNTTSLQAPLTSVSTVEYWQLDRNSGSANAKVKLFWGASSGFSDTLGLRVARWSGVKWLNAGKTASTGNATSGTITSGNQSSFGPFTFGRVNTQSITTSAISGSPFCPEATINVPFTSSGTYNAGNVYTAQLSSPAGSFASPTSIGNLNSTGNSGNIISTLPAGTTAGSAYRIRVVSSNPPVTGSNNGSNLIIQACGKPTGLNATNITASTATISWDAVSCASKYKFQYRVQGTTPWTSSNNTATTKSLSGLSANTTYEYRVQTLCTPTGSSKSQFTAISVFTTSTLKEEVASSVSIETFRIYPNPTSGLVTLELSNPLPGMSTILISNMLGQNMILEDLTLHEGLNQIQLNLDKLSPGIYFVGVTNAGTTITQRLVKE